MLFYSVLKYIVYYVFTIISIMEIICGDSFILTLTLHISLVKYVIDKHEWFVVVE